MVVGSNMGLPQFGQACCTVGRARLMVVGSNMGLPQFWQAGLIRWLIGS